MEPVATPLFFYVLSALAVASGIVVITRRNPVHSALGLIVTLLSLAGLYLMLYAPFVAGVQIILYAGGITVLFLFVIMLVNVEEAQRQEQFNRQWHVGIGVSVFLGVLFLIVYVKGNAIFPRNPISLPEETNVQQVAMTLYQQYLLPFEIASLLLLVAIVGAVVMAKKRV